MSALVHRVLPEQPYTDLAAYEAAGGGAALRAAREVEPIAIVEELEASGLRGRGGAGFPTGRKWRTVLEYESDVLATTMVVNAAEGEPGTFKDRAILLANPYAVIEGALIAATVVGARDVIIATKASFTDVVARLRAAIEDVRAAGWLGDITVEVHEGPGEYLYGEETALLESIDGREPFPRVAPPFRRGVVEVVEHDDDVATSSSAVAHVELAGVDAELAPPALVDNVETIANVPGIVREGAAWFRELGTERSPGTIVCTITGSVASPGVGEIAMGTTLRTAIEEIGGGTRRDRRVQAVLTGVSNGPVMADQLDVPLTYEDMAAIGTGLGSAGYIVLDDLDDLVGAMAGVLRFLAVESCGQCMPCKLDGLALAELFENIAGNRATARDIDRVRDRVRTVARGARCNIGRQEEAIAASALALLDGELRAHIAGERDPVAPMVVAELVTVTPGEAVVDVRHAEKQPDWTYDEEWSGQLPAERLGEHRAVSR